MLNAKKKGLKRYRFKIAVPTYADHPVERPCVKNQTRDGWFRGKDANHCTTTPPYYKIWNFDSFTHS